MRRTWTWLSNGVPALPQGARIPAAGATVNGRAYSSDAMSSRSLRFAMGHEDHLLPPKLSARSVIRRADRRRDMRQWARRAESRHFIFRAGASEDPHHRPFSDLI